MGYSNILYAVDIDKLKSILRNGDRKLAEQLRAKAKKKQKNNKKLRVEVEADGAIVVGDVLMSLDELLVEIKRPKWRGKQMDLVSSSGKRQTPKQAKNVKAIIHAEMAFNVISCIDDLKDSSDDDDEILTECAAAELLEGRCTHPDCAHQYGYGLMLILDIVGKHLGTIPGNWDESILWKTKLERLRSPVKLPRNDDFPYISYLSSTEVVAEFKKFSAMELDGEESWIREYREDFLKILRRAEKLQVGIISFFH